MKYLIKYESLKYKLLSIKLPKKISGDEYTDLLFDEESSSLLDINMNTIDFTKKEIDLIKSYFEKSTKFFTKREPSFNIQRDKSIKFILESDLDYFNITINKLADDWFLIYETTNRRKSLNNLWPPAKKCQYKADQLHEVENYLKDILNKFINF